MNDEAYILWGQAYAFCIAGYWGRHNEYHSFTDGQRERQLARLSNWWEV